MTTQLNLGPGHAEMIRGVRHLAKWQYVRVARAFRKAIKLSSDEKIAGTEIRVAEIRRMGAEGHLQSAARLHASLGHRFRANIAQQLARSFARVAQEATAKRCDSHEG